MSGWGFEPVKYTDTMRPAPTAGTPKYPNGSPYSVGTSGEPKLAKSTSNPIIGTGGPLVAVTKEEYDLLVRMLYGGQRLGSGISNQEADSLMSLIHSLPYPGDIEYDLKKERYRFELNEDVVHSIKRENLW
jgi:hypothetical protein